jgi:hypothetical protein
MTVENRASKKVSDSGKSRLIDKQCGYESGYKQKAAISDRQQIIDLIR